MTYGERHGRDPGDAVVNGTDTRTAAYPGQAVYALYRERFAYRHPLPWRALHEHERRLWSSLAADILKPDDRREQVMARRSFTSQLYRAARLSATEKAVASGDPKRMARRAKNVAIGRALGKAGVWRRLWR